jgi:hypothetical protein
VCKPFHGRVEGNAFFPSIACPRRCFRGGERGCAKPIIGAAAVRKIGLKRKAPVSTKAARGDDRLGV